MSLPNIPTSNSSIIYTKDINGHPEYKYLKIIDAVNDPELRENVQKGRYECMQPNALWTNTRCVLTRQGFVSNPEKRRIVAYPKLSLKDFLKIVKYDPSNPPENDYKALEMSEHHERTQSDFSGRKAKNRGEFRDYILEGSKNLRSVYLPTISGWQTDKMLKETVFVVLDWNNQNSLYGDLYLPDGPVMQADGQTQTAALFAVAKDKDAVENQKVLDNLCISLEIELGIDKKEAAQSFADRNGRGVKKSPNLVIEMDSSSPLSRIRNNAIKNTCFEDRIAGGKDPKPSENRTEHIVDLSTVEHLRTKENKSLYLDS